MVPDFVEMELCSKGYFTFLLPCIALGIESSTILEISVEYGLSLDGSQITANAWAREQNGVIKGFIQTVYVALGEDEQERIFEELNGNEGFLINLTQFSSMINKQQ